MVPDLLSHLRALPPVRVLYTDMDGTLLGRGGVLLADACGRPTARAAGALVAARQAGITVVLVSGRRHATMAHDARLLGLRDYIAEAGTVIVRDGRVTYEWGEAPQDVAETPRETLRATGALDVLLDAFPGDLRVFAPWDDGRVGEFLLHGRIDVDEANRLLADAGSPWACVIDNGATDGWPGRDVRAYHLLPRGTGKARAVADDLRARDLDATDAAACGDSLEDLTMAEAVATYVQVANGHGAIGGNVFAVPGAMSEGFADTVDAILAVRREGNA